MRICSFILKHPLIHIPCKMKDTFPPPQTNTNSYPNFTIHIFSLLETTFFLPSRGGKKFRIKEYSKDSNPFPRLASIVRTQRNQSPTNNIPFPQFTPKPPPGKTNPIAQSYPHSGRTQRTGGVGKKRKRERNRGRERKKRRRGKERKKERRIPLSGGLGCCA